MHTLAHVGFVKLVHVFLKWLEGTSNTNPNQVSNLHLCEVLARNSKFNSISDGALPRSGSVSSPSADDSGHGGRAGAHHPVSLCHRSCPPSRSWPLRRCCVSSVSGRFFRHVARPCFKCFSCFRCMFHLFHVDIAKVDWDVAIVLHICCKHLSPMFHLFFVHICCKCFKRISQLFHLSSFCILQVLHLDVSKVDRDVAHVAMVFELYVPNILSVLDVYCKSFIWMLQK
jgi:hypothetical protein